MKLNTYTYNTLLINTLKDCILINNLGVLTENRFFSSFENLCILLDIEFSTIDPDLFKELEIMIKKTKLIAEFPTDSLHRNLDVYATELLPKLIKIVERYK